MNEGTEPHFSSYDPDASQRTALVRIKSGRLLRENGIGLVPGAEIKDPSLPIFQIAPLRNHSPDAQRSSKITSSGSGT